MRRLRLIAVIVALGVLAMQADSCPAGEGNESDTEFFERKIRPLLAQHCYSCHGKGQKKGGLSLASRKGLLAGGESGAVVVLNRPEESPLIRAVEYKDDPQMPPSARLADQEIALLSEWIARGAPWPESLAESGGGTIRSAGAITDADRQFWSFQPPLRAALPAVQNASWSRNSIDRFALAQLDARSMPPVKDADTTALIRRATFDLTGLPPSPDEVAGFLADDSPDAYERLIDRLLASPRYGERWARHWLDVARYGEDQAHTFEARLYPSGYRYRDWVVSAFNADMPYQRFILEQIAGDLLTDSDKLVTPPALGFFALGPVYYADAGCAPKAKADEVDDRIDTLCRGFLGLTVSCARCHDHKFDPITTKDYYALAGVFASTDYFEAPLAPPDVVAAYDQRLARVKEQEMAIEDARKEIQREIRESLAAQLAKYAVAAWKLQNKRKGDAQFAAASIAKEDGLHEFAVEACAKFFAGDNLKKHYLAAWKDATFGQDSTADLSADAAALATIEEAAAQLQAEVSAALERRRKKEELDPPAAELLKDLIDESKDSPFAVPKDRVQELASEERRKQWAELRKELEERKKQVGEKYPFAHSVKEGEAKNLRVHVRGNHKELGDEVPRRFLEVLSRSEAPTFSKGSGRLELAERIASEGNPLTARVMVNRVWQNHFGRGLVGTPSNFGTLGERPTHPELLDDLASRFMAVGWSLKWLHRQIMGSSTYRLATDFSAENFAKDPDNRLLWRMNRRRLDIESWRDALLASSGSLDLTLGGPPQDLGAEGNRRRTLYAAVSRHNLNPALRLFDFPDPNLTSERRVSTTVPMQQLFVLNSEFMIGRAKALAARLQSESADDIARIRFAYQLLFSRKPSEKELQLSTTFLKAAESQPDVKLTPWERYTQALLGTNEFVFVD